MLSARGFTCRHIWKVNNHLDRDDLELIRVFDRWTISYGRLIVRLLGPKLSDTHNIDLPEISNPPNLKKGGGRPSLKAYSNALDKPTKRKTKFGKEEDEDKLLPAKSTRIHSEIGRR